MLIENCNKRHSQLNSEKRKIKWAKYYARNAERLRAASLLRSREWRASERGKTYMAAYLLNHEVIERRRANKKIWDANNRIKNAVRASNRRAKEKSGGSYTTDDIDRIKKAQKSKCAYCRAHIGNGFHIDHIMALSKGGSNEARNLQILCPSCNHKKCARDPIEFAQISGFLI